MIGISGWFYELECECDPKQEIVKRIVEIGDFHKRMDMMFQLHSIVEYPRPQLELYLKTQLARWTIKWEECKRYPPNSDIITLSLNPSFRSAQFFALISLLKHNLLQIKF